MQKSFYNSISKNKYLESRAFSAPVVDIFNSKTISSQNSHSKPPVHSNQNNKYFHQASSSYSPHSENKNFSFSSQILQKYRGVTAPTRKNLYKSSTPYSPSSPGRHSFLTQTSPSITAHKDIDPIYEDDSHFYHFFQPNSTPSPRDIQPPASPLPLSPYHSNSCPTSPSIHYHPPRPNSSPFDHHYISMPNSPSLYSDNQFEINKFSRYSSRPSSSQSYTTHRSYSSSNSNHTDRPLSREYRPLSKPGNQYIYKPRPVSDFLSYIGVNRYEKIENYNDIENYNNNQYRNLNTAPPYIKSIDQDDQFVSEDELNEDEDENEDSEYIISDNILLNRPPSRQRPPPESLYLENMDSL